MKIGLLTQEYHIGENRLGGVAQAFRKIANWLAQNGHDVTVYMQGRQAQEFEELPHLRVVTLTPRSLVHWRLRSLVLKLPSFWRGLIWHWEVNAALAGRIMNDYRCGRIEVLLTNRGVTAPSLMIRRLLPTVVRAQCSHLQTLRADRVAINYSDWYLQAIQIWAIRNATKVYSPSAYVSKYLYDLLGLKVPVIPTPMFAMQEPLDGEQVRKHYGIPSRYVIYWGSFHHRKGVHVLADALPDLFRLSPDLHVVMVGVKDVNYGNVAALESYLRLRSSKTPDRLHILTPLDQAELFALIRNSRVAVLPSILDNLPNTLLEAMYYGAIIVGSDGASINELITDGVNGLLVELNQPKHLVDAIIKADRMTITEREMMSRAVSERVKIVCSPDLVMERVVKLCQEACYCFE